MHFIINRKKPIRLLFYKGSHSWEIQIGHHVFQMRHDKRNKSVKRFHHFYTEYL